MRLITHIHMHPLFFETGLKCHGCDICSDQMKAERGVDGWVKTVDPPVSPFT